MNIDEEFDIFYIDLNRLEEQIAEHSFLFIQHSKDLNDARVDATQAKSELDLIKADIGHWVVKDPKKYNLPEKINAAMIERVVLRHKKQKAALEIYLEKLELVNTLQIYVAAYEHRKRMLSKAVELHGQQYFAKPYVATSEIKEVVDMLEKKRLRTKGLKSKGKGKKKRGRDRDNS